MISNNQKARSASLDIVVETIAEQLYCNTQNMLKNLSTDDFRAFLVKQNFCNFYESRVFSFVDTPWKELDLMYKRTYIANAQHILDMCPMAFLAQFDKWVAHYKKNHIIAVSKKIECTPEMPTT